MLAQKTAITDSLPLWGPQPPTPQCVDRKQVSKVVEEKIKKERGGGSGNIQNKTRAKRNLCQAETACVREGWRNTKKN